MSDLLFSCMRKTLIFVNLRQLGDPLGMVRTGLFVFMQRKCLQSASKSKEMMDGAKKMPI